MRVPYRVSRAVALALLSALLVRAPAYCAPQIESVTGMVTVVPAGAFSQVSVERSSRMLAAGDRVRTGPGSSAVIVFDDGSKASLGPASDFLIQEITPKTISLELIRGLARTWVTRLQNRSFRLRTPTATCSVRGTEFQVGVGFNGATTVELYKGLLSVSDVKGNEFMLSPGQRMELDTMGGSTPRDVKNYQTAPPPTSLQASARKEVGLDMKKDEVLAAAARELKLAEYQQGKALMDVFGNRVRVEEYVIRPKPDEFKLVVLNERESRFDYFYYKGTFNKALPTDLSIALRQIGGGLDAAPEYYLTKYETGRSNTTDSIRELAQDGHQVDLNNNGDGGSDDVSSFFDPALDRYVDAAGRSVFQTVYDKYGFYVNGTLKYGWTGSNLQAYSNRTDSTSNDPITGLALGYTVPINRSVASGFMDGEKLHQTIIESYSDGSYISWDNYIIDDEGKVGTFADFNNAVTGTSFKEKLLGWNYEQVITATEFQGRKIDLVVEPKILIQSGLMP